MKTGAVCVTVLAVLLLTAAHAAATGIEGDPEAARPINDRAVQAYGAGNYAEAARLFEQAYEAYHHPQFLYNAGQSYRRAGSYVEAVGAYSRHLLEAGSAGLQPDTTAYIHMGECMLRQNRRAEANQFFERYLREEEARSGRTDIPEDAEVARRAIATGQFPSEQDRRDPDQLRQAQALFDRARAVGSGDVARAAEMYMDGWRRYQMPEFLWNAAFYYQFADNLEQAAARFREYLQTPGADPEGYFALGMVLVSLGQSDEARQALERYLQLRPRGQNVRGAREQLRLLTEGSGPSADDVRRAREAFATGQRLYRAGQFQQALPHFTTAYQLTHDRAAHFNIAMCCQELHNWQEAANQWDAYARAGDQGGDAVTHLFAARAMLEVGNTSGARQHVQAFLRLADQHELPAEQANRRYAEGLTRDIDREEAR